MAPSSSDLFILQGGAAEKPADLRQPAREDRAGGPPPGAAEERAGRAGGVVPQADGVVQRPALHGGRLQGVPGHARIPAGQDPGRCPYFSITSQREREK